MNIAPLNCSFCRAPLTPRGAELGVPSVMLSSGRRICTHCLAKRQTTGDIRSKETISRVYGPVELSQQMR